ncbi:MAG: MFS transporter [Actinomycetota bacterium]|nr:MFS transporter [Actinomycetota bacterium]
MPPSVIVAVLCIGGATVSVMQSILIPLLTDLPGILGVSVSDASWLVTATLLAGAIATPSLTRLADMYGKKRMMLASLSMLLFGSLLAVVSTNLWTLVVARAFQGTASAVIAIGISVMRDALPADRLNSSVALLSATLGIGSAFGLPMAGVMFAAFGWQSVFWLSAVLAAALLVAVSIVIQESDVRTGGSFDVVGALLLSAALFCLLLAITKGTTWGWSSSSTLTAFGGSALLFIVWVPWEQRVRDPLVDIKTTLNRPVLMTHLTAILIGASIYINSLATLQLLQLPISTGYAFGLTAAHAGLLMVPAALMSLIVAPWSARITKNFGARITLCCGALVMAIGYFLRIPLGGALFIIILASIVVSIGMAIAFGAMPTLLMAAVPITQTAAANGINTLARASGAALSSAAVAALLAGSTIEVGEQIYPSDSAFIDAFLLGGFIALIAAGMALTIRVKTSLFDAHVISDEQQLHIPVVLMDDRAAKTSGRTHDITRHGRVVDGNGQPIVSALVEVLNDSDALVDWSHTDGEGHFAIAIPEPGSYRTVVSAQGWDPASTIVDFTIADAGPEISLAPSADRTLG